MAIDETVTLMGSMNWTRGAAANSEDLNLVSSSAVASAYAAHWHNRLSVSSPFARRVGLVPGPPEGGALMRGYQTGFRSARGDVGG